MPRLWSAPFGERSRKKQNRHSWGTTMRTMIDIAWHALESKSRLPGGRVRLPRTARWRNLAIALIFAAISGPLATERVLAAGPGDNEIRIGNTMPYSGPAASCGVIGKVIAA